MDLFELLFIALFLLFPLLEGVLKRKRQTGADLPSSGETPPEAEDEPWAVESEEEWRSAGPDRAEPASASDMVPEDLWAVLTGEERPVAVETEAEAPAPEPWSVDEEEPEPAPPAEPGSREYRGPEAYSLEEYEREPLERTVPSPEVRHRRFHDLIDAPRRRTVRPRRGVARALASPESLRQAFVLSEVLGPPKGLE